MRPKDTHLISSSLFFIPMSVALDLPVPLAISVLRAAGTGDSLLAALDAIVTETPEVSVADEVAE